MFFSVLMPVYNTSRYLRQSIESVLGQTEHDYEIILIDDGSTDESSQICDEYADKYPCVRVIHKDNEGLLLTRRRGFQEATGDYCICLDSDDYLNSTDALKKVKEYILQNQCDLVFYEYIMGDLDNENYRRITLFDQEDGHIFENTDKRILYEKLLLGQFFNPVCIKVISKSIIDVDVDYAKWKKSLVNGQGEDLFQSMPILDRAQRVGYIKQPFYFYRWNGSSISRNIKLEYYYAYRTIYKREDYYLNKWHFTQEQIEICNKQRMENVLGIISLGLHNKQISYKKWHAFVCRLSKDRYYRELYCKVRDTNILKYYQLLGTMIYKGYPEVASALIYVVGFIANLKRKGKKKHV